MRVPCMTFFRHRWHGTSILLCYAQIWCVTKVSFCRKFLEQTLQEISLLWWTALICVTLSSIQLNFWGQRWHTSKPSWTDLIWRFSTLSDANLCMQKDCNEIDFRIELFRQGLCPNILDSSTFWNKGTRMSNVLNLKLQLISGTMNNMSWKLV